MIRHYIVLGLCLLLLGFLLWKEWRRADRRRLFGRLIATVVTVGALACLALPLYYQRAVLRPAAPLLPAPAEPRGVVSVDWQRRLNPGEKLLVQGRWAGGEGRLLLMGMGSVLDSARVGSGGKFLLGTLPAQKGRAVYRLVAMMGRDTLEQEELPVSVDTAAPLKILLLAASPDFENTFLSNWLSKEGDVVASRTVVSREKVQEAFINRGPAVLSPLTPALLDGFDLVIADVAALPARGGGEWTVLRRQVEERGLGLLIKVDSAGVDSMGRVLKARVGRSLVRDPSGRVVAGSVLMGAGKVVFTGLLTSYSRVLAGEQSAYAAYWTSLLQEAARRGEGGEVWSWEPALPRVEEPVVMRLQTAVAMPQAMVGGSVVYLAQDAVLPFFWRGTYWPEAAGWQPVCRPAGDTTWWYVWPAGAWKGVEQTRRMAEVKNPRRQGAVDLAGGALTEERVPVAKGWFWGLFLLGALFLWVERKMGGMNG